MGAKVITAILLLFVLSIPAFASETPGMPKADMPETPKVDTPGMPKADMPETPKVDTPGMPKADMPEVPE